MLWYFTGWQIQTRPNFNLSMHHETILSKVKEHIVEVKGKKAETAKNY